MEQSQKNLVDSELGVSDALLKAIKRVAEIKNILCSSILSDIPSSLSSSELSKRLVEQGEEAQ